MQAGGGRRAAAARRCGGDLPRRCARGTARAALGEINVTPLVDVVLVLLLVFMVTAPMMSRGIDVSLPVANQPQTRPGGPRHGLASTPSERDLHRRPAGQPRCCSRTSCAAMMEGRHEQGRLPARRREPALRQGDRGRGQDQEGRASSRSASSTCCPQEKARAVNDASTASSSERAGARPRLPAAAVVFSVVGHAASWAAPLLGAVARRRRQPPIRGRDGFAVPLPPRRRRPERARAARPRRRRRSPPPAPAPEPPAPAGAAAEGHQAAEGGAAQGPAALDAKKAKPAPNAARPRATPAAVPTPARGGAPAAPARRPALGIDRPRRARRPRRHRRRRRLVPRGRAAEDLDRSGRSRSRRASRSPSRVSFTILADGSLDDVARGRSRAACRCSTSPPSAPSTPPRPSARSPRTMERTDSRSRRSSSRRRRAAVAARRSRVARRWRAPARPRARPGAAPRAPRRSSSAGPRPQRFAVPATACPRAGDEASREACRTVTAGAAQRPALRGPVPVRAREPAIAALPALNPDAPNFEDWQSSARTILVVTRAQVTGGELAVEAEVLLRRQRPDDARQALLGQAPTTRASSPTRPPTRSWRSPSTAGWRARKIAFMSDRDATKEQARRRSCTSSTTTASTRGASPSTARSTSCPPGARTAARSPTSRTARARPTSSWPRSSRARARTSPNGRGQAFAPAFSPDGKRIAYASNRSGNMEIWVANADGSGARKLTSSPATDTAPSWSPTGPGDRVHLRPRAARRRST